ncbi:hypothetical protein EIP86_006989 [Pleurotus ostreatoroseus]|nr:hypothetical protein EIP86_006989 [Pleurotus ostreatoroseus]
MSADYSYEKCHASTRTAVASTLSSMAASTALYTKTFELSGFSGSINALAFSGKGDYLAIGDDRGTVTILDHVHKAVLLELLAKQAVTALHWHSTRPNILFCGYADGGVVIFDLTMGGREVSLVFGLVFSAISNYLAEAYARLPSWLDRPYRLHRLRWIK